MLLAGESSRRFWGLGAAEKSFFEFAYGRGEEGEEERYFEYQ